MMKIVARIVAVSLVVLFAAPLALAEQEQVKPAPIVGWLELSGHLVEGQVPFAWLSEMESGTTLAGVLKQLDTVATSDRYLGVVIYLDGPELRFTQTQALGEAIRKVRDAGRSVFVFAESYTLMDYVLASYADKVLIQHHGELDFTGLSMEELYLAGLLDKIGVRADLEQIGQYKGANETLTRTAPSGPWSQNIDALLDDLYGQVLATVSANRGVTKETVEQWMADAWTLDDEQMVQRKIVDQLVDRDLLTVTEAAFGDDFVWDDELGLVTPTMQIDSPFAVFSMMFKKPSTQTQRPTLAVIHANGPITSGDSEFGSGMFSEESIGSRTLVRALGDVRDDDNVKGAVIQIDSPGGSALASEVIWQAVRKTAEQKPVYVSVGPMAASGGYYIAVAADQIYVHPQSIVGSIGVVGGKMVLGGLYAKIGVTVTQRDRGPMAGIYNSTQPFTLDQRAVVRAAMQRTYDQFVERVKLGRGTRLSDVNAVAEGRLFTGKAAVANGMADKLGTLDDAVTDLAAELKLKEGEYDVLHLPPALSFEEFLSDLFEARSPAVQTAAPVELQLAREALGPQAWAGVQRTLAGLMLLRSEPVLLLMPQTLVFR